MDYKTIWIKWIAFLQMDLKFRKETLEYIHIELQNGLTLLAQIAEEELKSKITDQKLFETIQPTLNELLAASAWAGYTLFLIENAIDPEKQNLVARSETNEVGNVWMEIYEKDQGKQVLSDIDPIISILLGNQKEMQINQLLVENITLVDLPYKEMGHIDTFFNWITHQGYILGMLEQRLFQDCQLKKAEY